MKQNTLEPCKIFTRLHEFLEIHLKFCHYIVEIYLLMLWVKVKKTFSIFLRTWHLLYRATTRHILAISLLNTDDINCVHNRLLKKNFICQSQHRLPRAIVKSIISLFGQHFLFRFLEVIARGVTSPVTLTRQSPPASLRPRCTPQWKMSLSKSSQRALRTFF